MIAIVGSLCDVPAPGHCFDDIGHDMASIDMDDRKFPCLNGGIIPFHLQSLTKLVARNMTGGRMLFSSDADVSCSPKMRRRWQTLLRSFAVRCGQSRRAKESNSRKLAMGRNVIEALGGDACGKCAAMPGLRFKPDAFDLCSTMTRTSRP